MGLVIPVEQSLRQAATLRCPARCRRPRHGGAGPQSRVANPRASYPGCSSAPTPGLPPRSSMASMRSSTSSQSTFLEPWTRTSTESRQCISGGARDVASADAPHRLGPRPTSATARAHPSPGGIKGEPGGLRLPSSCGGRPLGRGRQHRQQGKRVSLTARARRPVGPRLDPPPSDHEACRTATPMLQSQKSQFPVAGSCVWQFGHIATGRSIAFALRARPRAAARFGVNAGTPPSAGRSAAPKCR